MTQDFLSRPVPAVSGVVLEREEVLLVRRKEPPYVGRWSFPGGTVEVGEAMHEAGVREVREETGLDVRPVELVGAYDSIVKQDGEVRFHYELVDFLCQLVGGELRPGTDASAAEWVPLVNLEKMDLTPLAHRATMDCGADSGGCGGWAINPGRFLVGGRLPDQEGVRVEQAGVLENPHRPLRLGPLDGHLAREMDELHGLNLFGILGTILRAEDAAKHEKKPTLPFGVAIPDSNAMEGGHLVDGHVTACLLQGLTEGGLLDPLPGLDPAGGENETPGPLAMSDDRETALFVPNERHHLAVGWGLFGFVSIGPVPVDHTPSDFPVLPEDPVDLLVRGALEPSHGPREEDIC